MKRSFKPIEVNKELLERFKKVPVATVWGCLHNYLGVPLPFMENVKPMTPNKRLAARARTLRFLPPRPDIDSETKVGEKSPLSLLLVLPSIGEISFLFSNKSIFRPKARACSVP